MAKYCPNCYVGVSYDDEVCGNCGAVLGTKNNTDEILTSEDSLKENVSEESSKEISAEELSADETVPKEIIADEIIIAPIIAEEIVVTDSNSGNEKPETPHVYEKAPLKVANTAEVMSLGDWMLTLLLLIIPIVNIVMLIIWSVDSNTNENKKHFAWAYLIFMAIGIVVSIIFSSILISAILASLGTMY